MLRLHSRNGDVIRFAEAKGLLGTIDMDKAPEFARRIVTLTARKGLYWSDKALDKGLAHLRSGEARYRIISLLHRFKREIWAREHMGSMWTIQNPLVLLQLRGVVA